MNALPIKPTPQMAITIVIQLGFLGAIWYYLRRLEKEKCECAFTNDYKILSKLIYVPLSWTILVGLVVLLMTVGVVKSIPGTAAVGILYTIVAILNLIFLIISMKYLVGLYKSACACSDNSLRLVYIIYVAFVLGMLALMVLLFFFMILALLPMMMKN
jgi:hypothetical protein